MAHPRAGDDRLVVTFKNEPKLNADKTQAEGRPIYDEREVCTIGIPGSRSYRGVYPATEFSHWEEIDPTMPGGELRKVSYAERFAKQYRQFREKSTQTISGTPLDHAPFLTPSRRIELSALGVYTLEQLARIDGQELKNIGVGGRDEKNRAIEMIETSRQGASHAKLAMELEAERSKNQILQEDLERARKAQPQQQLDAEFEDMSDEQLRGLITSNTGQAPQGNPAHKTLVRMATETKPSRSL
jgi:hypothetical protein